MSEALNRVYNKLDLISEDITEIKESNAAANATMLGLGTIVQTHTEDIKSIHKGAWRVLLVMLTSIFGWIVIQ